MKKDRKTASTKQTSTPQIGRLTLLVGALVATGVLSPLSLPTATAASLPVPMGLPCGGCIGLAKNAPANLYSNFVQLGKVTTSNIDPITGLPSDNQLTIDQHDSQVAILNWQQFNIDKGNTVTFVQPSSTSSALNRIWDADPSHIAGNLNANGQIYLINQNGIVFHNGSQVNVNTLIASSLDITDQLFKDGYLTNTRVIPAFSGIGGFIKVETGAVLNGSRIMLFAPVVENSGTINTPDGQTILAAGHRVYLQASQDPNLRGMLVEVDVDNAGVADTVLADNAAKAGVVLQHTEAGVVTNAGDIASERGNTTLVGFAVNQQGRISATTSVTENGSIKLLARYNVAPESADTENNSLKNQYKLPDKTVYDIRATKTGKVTLAAGSTTAVTPQEIWDAKLQKWVPDTATTNDGQGFNPSIVEVMGNTIEMQNNSKIIVPGGQVTLAAISSYVPAVAEVPATATTPKIPAIPVSGLIPVAADANNTGPYQPYYKDNAASSFLNPNYKPVSSATDSARVFMDKGSVIDVSGSSAEVSVARNILKVQLRGSQLADSPVQRVTRNLWGKDVLIDIRKGTALAAYAAEEAQLGRTVAERTATGGNVKLVSTGDVVMKRDAIVNISGGLINYKGADITTTNVVVHGVAYDIAKATPEQIYEAVSGDYKVEHKKWGVTETFSSMSSGDMRDKPTIAYDVRWDPGYLEGKSAGSLTVLAPKAVVDGDIVAHTVAGIYQRQAYVDPATLAVNNYKNTWQMMPQGGLLVVGDSKPVVDIANNGLTDFITDSKVTIQSGAAKLDAGFSLFSMVDVLDPVTMLPILDPVTGLHVKKEITTPLPSGNQQEIVLNADNLGASTGVNRLEVYSNNAISVAAGTTVKLAPGGSITLQGGEVNMLGSIDAPSGKVKLGTSVTDPVLRVPGALRIGMAGTNSYISTRGRWVNDSVQWGTPDWSSPVLINGGNIDLSSGADLLVASGTKLDASGGAWLDVNGKITGGNGGAITLASGKPQGVPFKVQLDGVDLRSYGTAGGKGGSLALKADGIRLGGSATNGELVLPEAFFQNGGFSSYNLTAQGGLTVSEGAVIEPKTQSLILDRTATQRRSGTDVTSFAKVGLLPEWQRKAANISLTANNGSSLTVEAGAVVRVEPTASISLSATNQLNVFGTLDARAGSISLSLDKLDSYLPTQSIWLGSQSRVLSQGYFLQSQPNAQNLVQGQVLSGGKINIIANTGYVVAQQGSVMDVSGSSADVVLPQFGRGGLNYRTNHVAGDAGSISVQTSEGGFLDGTLKADVEAGSQAAGGGFSLTLNNSVGITNLANNSNAQFPQSPARILVSADGNGNFATQAGLPTSDSAAGLTDFTNALAGKMMLDAGTLNKSGFDQVTLRSGTTISLADHADIQTRRSVTLDAPQLLVNGNSKITSGLVTIGNFDQSQQALLDPLLQVRMQPAAGTGTLNVSGQMVDLTGNFIVSGINQLTINSSNDVRFNGIVNDARPGNTGAMDTTNVTLQGSLHTQGNVTLQAAQVYPSTLAQFTMSVEDGAGNKAGSITIQPGGTATNSVLSAGGLVKLSANIIEQNGVLKAPMGTINLDGRDRVKLGTGSLTSVSANGLIMPFGIVEGGNTWKYDLTGTGNYVVTVDAPPQKQVKLTAPNIDVQSGAAVDLSGNGDLYAHEFFAGSGGSVNVLDPVKAAANTFAIVPGISGYSPYDPQYAGQYNQTGSKTTLQPGASVYLAGGAGLKAGYYTLLPASYALLPGAYRITAVSGYGDRQPAQGVTTLTDGSQIMAGKFAVVGTNIQDARFSGFMLTPNAVVRTQSEYHYSYANAFFANQANTTGTAVPRLASDAGQLIISATGNGATLALEGNINAAHAADGRGSMIDLNGPGFDIVNATGPATGRVQLTTATLNKLAADSLLIGGVRTQTATGMSVEVGAGVVVVNNAGSALTGPEIILAANNAVSVKSGSVIEGKGTLSGQASNITIANVNADTTPAYGDGALLRVSSATQVTVARTNLAAVPVAAKLTVEDGATVGAQNNAILLDSSNVATVGNNANLKGQSLSIAAQNIDIGTNPAPAPTSLALSGALLSKALAFKDLTLHSYNDINFYGTSALGGVDANQQHILNNLVLNSRSLNGVLNDAGQTSIIDAKNVTLLNNNAGTSATVAYGTGNLKINADQITLAEGNKSIQGFDTVTLAAAKQIVAQGTSNVTIAAGDANVHNLVLQAGQVTGMNKSNLTVTATNQDVSIQPVAGATVTASEALNAKLTIVGKSIANNGNIDLSSGAVTLHATGAAATDGVTLGSGSRTAATGISKVIAGQTAYAQAGSVSLIADSGNVDIRSGSVVDVRGAATGGDAGTINISASKGAVTVAGELKGVANAKYAQGSFTLDARTLTGTGNTLTNLNDILSAGGFTALRDMRLRTNNWVIEADAPGATSARAKAETFRLVADAGTIDVSGTVDASGTNGGSILLAARDNLTLNAGALLDAHASGAGQKGGKVTLETTTGGVIELNNQLIDVHGDGNTGGSVLLRAPQIAVAGSATNNEVALNTVSGSPLNISAGANVTVEAFKTYTSATGTLGTADVAATSVYKTDADAFATYTNMAAIKNRLGMTGLSNQHLTPGVEIDGVISATNPTGSLTLSKDWDLSTWRFNDGTANTAAASTEAGILTLRAFGNMQFGTVVGTTITTASLTDGVPLSITNNPYSPNNNNNINNTFGIKATGGPATGVPSVSPMTGRSWSYRLVSGADTSADVMAVKNDLTGNFTLVAGKEATTGSGTAAVTAYTMEQIRTGTGFIDIAAGGSFNLGNKDSVIYTFGQPVAGVPVTNANTSNRYFGEGGGDISILAKGDVNGAATDQLVTDWQWRQGFPKADGTIDIQPAWWINLQSFRQNVGALGGGNVSVKAGGNINTLSAVAPSTGYVDMVDPKHPTVVLGGGNLSVSAGGNINSGVFYVGNGQGSVRAGGSLGTNRKDKQNLNLYTVLALGQGNFDVRTGGDLNLETVLNPTAIFQGISQLPSATAKKGYFFTYGDTSSISLTSLSGDVLLQNNGNAIFYTTAARTNAGAAANGYTETGGGFFRVLSTDFIGATGVLPGSLIVNALGGSINSKKAATLFSSATGDLQLIAAKDIQFDVTMSDAAAGGLHADTVTTANNSTLPVFSSLTNYLLKGRSSIHANDDNPVIISAGGNISGLMTLPKAAQIEAGQDVLNLGLTVQNLKSTDTTSIVAGRDISYITTTASTITTGITVDGPGQVVLQAGRNVNLGQYDGVITTGNLSNPLLPEQGANITVLAGVGQGGSATQAFIGKYIDPNAPKTYGSDLVEYVVANWADLVRHGQASGLKAPVDMTGAQAYTYFGKLSKPLQDAFAGKTYDKELIAYVSNYGGSQNMTPEQAYSHFSTLSRPLQESFVRQVFFSELRNSGRYGLTTKNFQTGFDAISALFPSTGYKGDINLYYSQIKTMRGGDINLFAPGGGVNAGLANPSATGPQKTPTELGIVTVKGGDVNAFVNNDFMVNQSRVFTLRGNSDILLWSSWGSIDAGKGSKSVSATPPPLLVVDLATGAFNLDTSRSITGSGIGLLLSQKDETAGSIDLVAPHGEVNAGDAGIRSAGNIFIAAPRVVGADNISFGGSGAGVPVAAPAPVSVGLNLQDASKAADQATQSIASTSGMNTNDFKPTFLSIEVIGLGDKDSNPDQ